MNDPQSEIRLETGVREADRHNIQDSTVNERHLGGERNDDDSWSIIKTWPSPVTRPHQPSH